MAVDTEELRRKLDHEADGFEFERPWWIDGMYGLLARIAELDAEVERLRYATDYFKGMFKDTNSAAVEAQARIDKALLYLENIGVEYAEDVAKIRAALTGEQ